MSGDAIFGVYILAGIPLGGLPLVLSVRDAPHHRRDWSDWMLLIVFPAWILWPLFLLGFVSEAVSGDGRHRKPWREPRVKPARPTPDPAPVTPPTSAELDAYGLTRADT